MKTKGLGLWIKLVIVLLNTVNLALALALALRSYADQLACAAREAYEAEKKQK